MATRSTAMSWLSVVCIARISARLPVRSLLPSQISRLIVTRSLATTFFTTTSSRPYLDRNSKTPQNIADFRILATDETFKHLVNTIMKDGKKNIAEKIIVGAFVDLRSRLQANPTIAEPQPGEGQPVLKSHNTTDPHQLFKIAIDLASPLVRIMTIKKSGKNEQAPIPLNERQRRRRAIVWILDASDKRSDRDFSKRLAMEVIAVCNGTSNVYQQKTALHKLAVAQRANASVRL